MPGSLAIEFGLVADQIPEILGRESKALLLREHQGHRLGADERHPGLVDRKPRTRVYDFVAGVDVALDREADRGLRSWSNHYAIRIDIETSGLRNVLRDGLAKGQNTRRVAVVRIAGFDLFDRLAIDVRRTVEVGFSKVELHNVHTAIEAYGYVLAEFESVLGS
jgi:hypothetical protein